MINFSAKKVIVFGAQQIAVDCIQTLIDKGVDIQAVVTYEVPLDKKYGYASVRHIAKKHDITLYEPEKLTKDFIAQIKNLAPDLIISAYYRKIFPESLIGIPRLGCVNIHPGLLPYYRGPIPTFWAMIRGEKFCGVTLHFIDKNVDTGPIIDQCKLAIKDSDTGFSLNDRAMKFGHQLFVKNIANILNNKTKAIKQPANIGSYFGKFYNELRLIDWRKSSQDIFNQVRANSRPYSGAIASTLDKDFIVWKVKPLINKYPITTPGKILKILPDQSFIVSTSDGAVKITDYEFVGAKGKKVFNFYIQLGRKLC